VVEDPYIRLPHQIQNFVRLCETVVKLSNIKRIELVTGYDDLAQKAEVEQKLADLQQSLLEMDIVFEYRFNPDLHDREIRLDHGWVIKIGRGLDFYQKPATWHEIGVHDLALRRCLETKVDVFRTNLAPDP
jgi:ATP-dependent Lon protease